MADTQRGYFRGGRARSVKPEVFLHEGLFDLEVQSGLPVRLCWIALWTQCDREGRFRLRPRALKAALMPYDSDLDFSRVLDALRGRGFIVPYEVNGELYAFIPSWKKHQYINNREQRSDIPAPNEQHVKAAEKQPNLFVNGDGERRVPDASPTRESHVVDMSVSRPSRDGDGQTVSCERGDRERDIEQTQEHHASGALMKKWLAIKLQLQKEIPDKEWKLWVRPAYLLKPMGDGLLLSLPPNGRVIEAARSRLDLLKKLAAGQGFKGGVSFTRYPDEYELRRLQKENPEFFAQFSPALKAKVAK